MTLHDGVRVASVSIAIRSVAVDTLSAVVEPGHDSAGDSTGRAGNGFNRTDQRYEGSSHHRGTHVTSEGALA